MKKMVAPALFILGFILFSECACYAESAISPLGGEYSFVGTSSCADVQNQEDIFPPDFVLPSPGVMRIGHYQGDLHLNGDGTGTWEYFFSQYSPQFLDGGDQPFAAYQTVLPCDVVYEQVQNRLVLHILSGCISEVVFGFRRGIQFETGQINLTFFSSMNGDTLLLSKTRPGVEEIKNLDTGFVTKRLCARTYTAIRENAAR